MTEGFMVVEANPSDLSKVLNRRYRGLYRMVAVRPEKADLLEDTHASQDDPAVAGLNQSLDEAKKLLEKLAALRPHGALEIIFVRTPTEPWMPNVDDPSLELMGIDVAGDAPFYSIVADMPRDARIARFESLLNDYGLFEAKNQAADYARAYFDQGLTAGDADAPLKLWEVYRLKT